MTHSAENDALARIASHRVMLPLRAVLAGWRDGDEVGWEIEFAWLRSERQEYIDMLATSVQETGIRLPVLLGSDGRVWDGHHRLCVADMLAMDTVPCEFADSSAVIVYSPETRVTPPEVGAS